MWSKKKEYARTRKWREPLMHRLNYSLSNNWGHKITITAVVLYERIPLKVCNATSPESFVIFDFFCTFYRRTKLVTRLESLKVARDPRVSFVPLDLCFQIRIGRSRGVGLRENEKRNKSVEIGSFKKLVLDISQTEPDRSNGWCG